MEERIGEKRRQMAQRAIGLVGIAEDVETFDDIVVHSGLVARLILVPW